VRLESITQGTPVVALEVHRKARLDCGLYNHFATV